LTRIGKYGRTGRIYTISLYVSLALFLCLFIFLLTFSACLSFFSSSLFHS
jgi:hypothetical protein